MTLVEFSPENNPLASTPQILLAAPNPFGNLEAMVESDGRTVYLYLNGGETFGVRAVWVRNLIPGPLAFHREDLEAGRPPVLPRLYTHSPEPGPIPISTDLSFVWFAEGNGVALWERERLLAVIAPWCGLGGIHGYAADCALENEIVCPLPPDGSLHARIAESHRYWEQWVHDKPFQKFQPELLRQYEQAYGPLANYYNINGDQFPPRGLGVFRNDQGMTLATLGMSLCQMPLVELAGDPQNFPDHIELVCSLPLNSEERQVLDVAGRLSSIAGLPWREWTWLGENHTCQWLPQYGYPAAGLYLVRDPGDRRHCQLPQATGPKRALMGILPLSSHDLQHLQTNRVSVRQLAENS